MEFSTDGLTFGESRTWPFLVAKRGRPFSVVSAWHYVLVSGEQGHVIKTSVKGGLTGKGFSTLNLE